MSCMNERIENLRNELLSIYTNCSDLTNVQREIVIQCGEYDCPVRIKNLVSLVPEEKIKELNERSGVDKYIRNSLRSLINKGILYRPKRGYVELKK